MRADKATNVDLVASELVKNPLQTERQIAEKLGIDQSTVNRAKQELHNTTSKDIRVVNLTEADYEIQMLIQQRKLKKLYEDPEKITDGDLNNWDKHSTTRYTLLTGNATDENGGLVNPDTLEFYKKRLDELRGVVNGGE